MVTENAGEYVDRGELSENQRNVAVLTWEMKVESDGLCRFCGCSRTAHNSVITERSAIGLAVVCRSCAAELDTLQVVCWMSNGGI